MLLRHLKIDRASSILLRFNNKQPLLCTISKSTLNTQENANKLDKTTKKVHILNQKYDLDEWTNLNENILSKLGRNLYNQKHHPLNHIINRIKSFFYKKYINRSGNAIFSIYDNMNPVVTIDQNFDSLLVPKNHVSRSKNDCYYVNKDNLLRAHTSAHQYELIRSGLDAFLVFGDVYRRDEIDSKHYPVFHQCEGVRLYRKHELLRNVKDQTIEIFEKNVDFQKRLPNKQELHTLEATKLVEYELKNCLTDLVQHIFGTSQLNMKWIETTFPFTHPSWELEIEYKGKWYEVLGCGVVEQKILNNAGAQDTIGWAFGLGLERWAMILYDIPDIRLFWSNDTGFLSQFKYDDSSKIVKYKQISVYPQLLNDLSFWLPENLSDFSPNTFYDLVRDYGQDLVEQVELIDKFENKKTNRISHCYRITYRSTDRTLTQKEVTELHNLISKKAVELFNVKIR